MPERKLDARPRPLAQALAVWPPSNVFAPCLPFLSKRFSLAVFSGFFLACFLESMPLLMIFTSDNVVVEIVWSLLSPRYQAGRVT
jgi:hypothetical protein